MRENTIGETNQPTIPDCRPASHRYSNIVELAIIVKGLVSRGIVRGCSGWVVGGGF